MRIIYTPYLVLSLLFIIFHTLCLQYHTMTCLAAESFHDVRVYHVYRTLRSWKYPVVNMLTVR